MLYITEGTRRTFDHHVIGHFRFWLKLVLRNFQHVLVFVWDESFWSRRTAVIFYRCTSKVLLMGLVVEFLWFHNQLLLIAFNHSWIWCRCWLIFLRVSLCLLLKHEFLALLIDLISSFRLGIDSTSLELHYKLLLRLFLCMLGLFLVLSDFKPLAILIHKYLIAINLFRITIIKYFILRVN